MQPITTELDERVVKAIEAGVSALDIMHGELKILLVDAEQELMDAQEIEVVNGYSDAMESMERRYWEGQVDALSYLYTLTYQLSFAMEDQND